MKTMMLMATASVTMPRPVSLVGDHSESISSECLRSRVLCYRLGHAQGGIASVTEDQGRVTKLVTEKAA